MNDVLIAVIASVPGILLGIAALRRRKGSATAMQEMRDDLRQTRDDLDEARVKIGELERRVDDCDRERRTLIRENLDLYRRVDKANRI